MDTLFFFKGTQKNQNILYVSSFQKLQIPLIKKKTQKRPPPQKKMNKKKIELIFFFKVRFGKLNVHLL